MNCAEFKEQVGAYALDALGPHENQAMVAHLAEPIAHQGCQRELERARLTVARLSYALTPLPPRAEVWRAIEKQIASRLLPVRASRAWREAMAWTVAALAIAAAAAVYGDRAKQLDRAERADKLLAHTQVELGRTERGLVERGRCLEELRNMKGNEALQRAAIALLEKSSSSVVRLEPVPGGKYRASAIMNLKERRTIVVASNMPALPGKDFELWVIRGKAPPSPAGFLRSVGDGSAYGEIDARLLEGTPPSAFAVSVEPRGGRPTPTEVVMVGALPG